MLIILKYQSYTVQHISNERMQSSALVDFLSDVCIWRQTVIADNWLHKSPSFFLVIYMLHCCITVHFVNQHKNKTNSFGLSIHI